MIKYATNALDLWIAKVLQAYYASLFLAQIY